MRYEQEPNIDANSIRIIGAKLGAATIIANSHGDTWDAAWTEDGTLYVSSDDTYGFDNSCNSNLAFHRLDGDDPYDLTGVTINGMEEYDPLFGILESDGCCWKAMGVASIDGTLYMTISRHRYGMSRVDPMKRQQAFNASIIKSTDGGKTWTPSAADNRVNPMFYAYRFGTPSFVKYGRDGEARVHNADHYVYAVSNNGYWDNGDDVVLGRVLREKMSSLNGNDWEFYRGGNGMVDASWSKIIYDAEPIHHNPGKCSMTSVQYIEPLYRYVMIAWYYTAGSGEVGHRETVWEFYESPTPWGPWTKFSAFLFFPQGYYNPCIVPKFISTDGKNLILFTNGDFITNQRSPEENIYKLTMIPCELETE
ncbi:hypothetical protein A8709_14245 [Paenibacillus pectinilyticus]|uniref:DUF4185 domain-containing protein n=1 Tax=Paenibacillus pectinilyticus TaxID=512399 RepID=A0A1C1A3X7_9BACL|nr:DUF4185 domain-containing protein [Paenibacillus pectinilyticus]OCT15255.1 hypothetical protein A8709_14245 [Paenibacillus pectinilyticus]